MAGTPTGLKRTPLNAKGIRATMINALKITALRTALIGDLRAMMLSGLITGNAVTSIAGIIAKYLAISLAILKVVKAPRVMSICFTDLDYFQQFGRVRIKVHHVTRLLGRLSSGVHRHSDISLRESRRVVR
ncbi:MAG TPA: hypothetical protein VHO84_07470, partial [Syntrophorhabdaceae bacterium]|nr:hypothetical protein [Syntrophorhabdaceae bacterium]